MLQAVSLLRNWRPTGEDTRPFEGFIGELRLQKDGDIPGPIIQHSTG